ncbi:MAG TPA: hypothetical protein VEK57_20685 [Thermoanaerobaculia bacterium]|nr:hypothetical protein [Thermoanaerobaculia bacterium]
MSFLVKILFSGLMVFVPNENQTEVTVLLLNVDHAYHTSDGASHPPHNPVIVARAGGCSGSCTPDAAVAPALFRGMSTAAADDALEAAFVNGTAWLLNRSDVELSGVSGSLNIIDDVRGSSGGVPLLIPTNSTERKDFSWIADIKQLCPSCSMDEDVLGTLPPASIAARFTLSSGDLFTYSVARIGSDVTPVHFKRLDGSGSASSYSQAVATWVGAEIEVSGSNIQIIESKIDGGTGRTMTLTPDSNDTIEIAVLNLPAFVPPASANNNAPQAGRHFELYFDLADSPPAKETRFVPLPGALSGASYSQVAWSTVHPSTAVYSELLEALRLDVGRGPYDRTLCPPGQTTIP